jgi:hypothetical protein
VDAEMIYLNGKRQFITLARMIFLVVILSYSLLTMARSAAAATIWCNPANTGIENGLAKSSGYKTLWNAMSHMVSGDTVMIANGDWTLYPGMTIEDPNIPPSGTSSSYTRILAETEWEVRIPHIFVQTPRSYIELRGIVFDSRNNPQSHIVYDWSYTKFIRCGFLAGKLTGNNHVCGFGSADSTRSKNHHNLMEECIAWGGGRYVFYSKYGQYNIFRRCVARHDYNAPDAEQISNFRGYAVDYHVYQNCISIDSDRTQYYAPLNIETSGYWIGDQYGSVGNEIQGSLSIRDLLMGFYLAGSGSVNMTNNAVLDLKYGSGGADTLMAFVVTSGSAAPVTNTNFLGYNTNNSLQDGVYVKNSASQIVRDSIIAEVGDNGELGTSNSFVDHYEAGKGDWGLGGQTYNPLTNGLLYPVRIEAGSNLAKQGYNGGRIGPEILKKIGVSGTLYGQTGWNTVTDEDLWPFPNEDKIKELMSTTVSGVPGIYGFTAYNSPFGTPNTLTSYIWEYLGNPCPEEICNAFERTCGDTICYGEDCSTCPSDCGQCPVSCVHDADLPVCDGCVNIRELGLYVGRWNAGTVMITQLIEAIRLWKAGC